MTDITLNQFLRGGTLPAVWVYHVRGYNWAATNSAEFATWITDSEAYQNQIRVLLFGNTANFASFSAYDVQVLPILDHDLGQQVIKYDEDKGLNVGGWAVKIMCGDNGYTWSLDTEPTHMSGLLGVDWQPVISTPGVKSAVLSRDYTPNATTFLADLYWAVDSDNGLKTKIEASITAETERYLWCDSSCLAVVGESVSTTTDGGEYYISCIARQFGAPMQTLLKSKIESDAGTYITTVPLSLVASQGVLQMVPWAEGEILGAA